MKNNYKLPIRAYKLSLEEFNELIKNFPLEIKEKFRKRYSAISAALAAKEKEEKGITSGKLSEYQKNFIIEMAGRFFSPKQIMKVIKEDWNIKYSAVSLNLFLKRNSEIIEQKRFRYTSNVDNLRFVHERPRIEELTNIFEQAKEDKNHRIMIEALKEIRQEVKGDKLLLEGSLNANLKVDIKGQILNEIDIEMFGQLAIIRLLQKHNIDFLKIAHRMKKIFIEKENETGEEINKFLPVPIKGNQLATDAEILEIKNKEEKKVRANKEDIKELLKKKLKDKIIELKKVKENVDVYIEENPPDEKNKIKNKKRDK